jgi:hypothetical protein
MVRVRQVVPLAGHTLRLQFSDGSSGVVDVGPLLLGPVFEPLLRDRALFLSVRVDPVLGTLVWPNGADLDPDVLRSETRFT